jgi:hypothetical protein
MQAMWDNPAVAVGNRRRGVSVATGMRWPGLCLILLISSPAHAMGRYVQLGLIAWNADGTAALFTRESSSSGTVGATFEYVLVAAGASEPLVVSFNDTQDGDTRAQKVDQAACIRAAVTLQRALVAKRFRGVVVQQARCRDTRGVVGVLPEASRLVDGSWIAKPVHREPTARETASWEAAKLMQLGDEGSDVASLTGSLVVVLYGVNGDNTPLAHATVLEVTRDGPRVLVEDLR